MASIVIPGLDLAPSVPSRIVTVDVVDMTEGTPAAGAKIDFILPQDLHARSDGKVLKAGTTRLTLDSAGHGEIRVPAYSSATKPEDWVLLVKKSWAPYPYPIRVPTGATSISLAALEPPLEVTDNMAKYLLTDASATITEGAQWAVNVTTAGNIANFAFTAPPGGSPGQLAELTEASVLESLTDGLYRVPGLSIATALNLPGTPYGGLFTQVTSGAVIQQKWEPALEAQGSETWVRRRYNVAQPWGEWAQVPYMLTHASTDPTAVIEEGQSLLIISDNHVASVFPTASGFTPFWDEAVLGWQARLGGGRGGWVSTTGASSGGVTWDRFDDTLDSDITCLIAPSTINAGLFGSGPASRIAGATGTRNGIVGGLAQIDGTPHLIISQYAADVGASLNRAALDFPLTGEIMVRLRTVGDTVRAKAWPASSVEPADWMVDTNTTVTTRGRVGLHLRGVRGAFRMIEVQKL